MKILFAAPVTFERSTIFISQYFTGLARAAREMGHEARIIKTTRTLHDLQIWNIVRSEFLTFRNYFKAVADIPNDLLLGYQLYEEVKEYKPDLLYLHPIDTSHLHLFINRIKRTGTKVFVWSGVPPSVLPDGSKKLMRKSNRILIYDPSYIEHYSSMGMSNVNVLPLGCNPGYFDSVEPEEEFTERNGVDLCFIGNLDNYRERYMRSLLNYNMGIWGWNINEFNTPLRRFYKGTAFGDALVKIYKSSKIVLNLHRDQEVSGGNYRMFEIPACRAFQLVDEKRDIGEYFKIGDEIVTFKDENDLLKKTEYYLKHDEEREEIAYAGYRRVKRDHTLTNRLKKLIELSEYSN